MKAQSKNVTNVLNWRRRVKMRLLEAFGGKCGICGYDKCVRNLAFHHLDPGEKEFHFGTFQSKAWATIVAEVRKCVLLCANCHGEVHDGIADAASCPRFDEAYADRPAIPLTRKRGSCAVCRAPLKNSKKFCSIRCQHVVQERAERPTKDALDVLLSASSWEAVGRQYGVSGNAIRKWAKRAGLNPVDYGWARRGGAGMDLNLQPTG